MSLVNSSELGRILGVSHTAVAKALAKGRITAAERDGNGKPRFDPEAVMKEWAANTNQALKRPHKMGGRPPKDGTARKPGRPRKSVPDGVPLADRLAPPGGGDPGDDPDEGDDNAPNLNRATALEKHYKAKLAKLAYEEKAGTMVRIEAVAHVVDQEYSRVRARLLSIPSKLAADVALTDDVGACRSLIEAAVVDALNELAADAAAKKPGALRAGDDDAD